MNIVCFLFIISLCMWYYTLFFPIPLFWGEKEPTSHLLDKNAGATTHGWGVWWVAVRSELTHSVCPWSYLGPCWVWLALPLMFVSLTAWSVFPKDISPVANFLLLIPPPMIPLHPNSWTSKQPSLEHMSRHKDFIMYMYTWLNIKNLTIFLKPIQEYYQ